MKNRTWKALAEKLISLQASGAGYQECCSVIFTVVRRVAGTRRATGDEALFLVNAAATLRHLENSDSNESLGCADTLFAEIVRRLGKETR